MAEEALEGKRALVPEEALHELRVRIPHDLHRQLLSLKVLRGKSLADSVTTALDLYFAEHTRKLAEAAEAAQRSERVEA